MNTNAIYTQAITLPEKLEEMKARVHKDDADKNFSEATLYQQKQEWLQRLETRKLIALIESQKSSAFESALNEAEASETDSDRIGVVKSLVKVKLLNSLLKDIYA